MNFTKIKLLSGAMSMQLPQAFTPVSYTEIARLYPVAMKRPTEVYTYPDSSIYIALNHSLNQEKIKLKKLGELKEEAFDSIFKGKNIKNYQSFLINIRNYPFIYLTFHFVESHTNWCNHILVTSLENRLLMVTASYSTYFMATWHERVKKMFHSITINQSIIESS